MSMSLAFVNREAELRALDTAAKHGGLLVVFGRRRVGKTRLLRQWLHGRDGLYSQAIEAQQAQQIEQVFADLRGHLETRLVPKPGRSCSRFSHCRSNAGRCASTSFRT